MKIDTHMHFKQLMRTIVDAPPFNGLIADIIDVNYQWRIKAVTTIKETAPYRMIVVGHHSTCNVDPIIHNTTQLSIVSMFSASVNTGKIKPHLLYVRMMRECSWYALKHGDIYDCANVTIDTVRTLITELIRVRDEDKFPLILLYAQHIDIIHEYTHSENVAFLRYVRIIN